MKLVVGVIGMGYVGLPLAIEISKKHKVVGYDIDVNRINSLRKGIDIKNQISQSEIRKVDINYSLKSDSLRECNLYIVTVPTPLKNHKTPDFTFLKRASKAISKYLKKEDIVVYESTVYPGATEEICIPILEKSTLKVNKDFYVGYSPERINVGDPQNTLTTIPKIVSATNKYSLKIIVKLYSSILKSKVHAVSSIKVAEAAKIVENVQRDVNIAFVNELAMMFKFFEIDINEVLNAASTKWNFLNFRPGLVGGHCIGVDPYYLAHKSIALGYKPEILLSARKINEEVPFFILKELFKKLSLHKIEISKANVLFLGATFKENISDIRNSKALELATEINDIVKNLYLYDPYLDTKHINLGLNIISNLPKDKKFDILILAVKHDKFLKLAPLDFITKEGFVYDIKRFFKPHPKIYSL